MSLSTKRQRKGKFSLSLWKHFVKRKIPWAGRGEEKMADGGEPASFPPSHPPSGPGKTIHKYLRLCLQSPATPPETGSLCTPSHPGSSFLASPFPSHQGSSSLASSHFGSEQSWLWLVAPCLAASQDSTHQVPREPLFYPRSDIQMCLDIPKCPLISE